MESLYNDISDRLWQMAARTFTNLMRSQDLQFLVSPWSKHLAKTCCEGLIWGHSTREIKNVSFKALVKYFLSIIIIDLNGKNEYISGNNLLIIRFEHKNRIFFWWLCGMVQNCIVVKTLCTFLPIRLYS